jgi:hypothetical protein
MIKIPLKTKLRIVILVSSILFFLLLWVYSRLYLIIDKIKVLLERDSNYFLNYMDRKVVHLFELLMGYVMSFKIFILISIILIIFFFISFLCLCIKKLTQASRP